MSAVRRLYRVEVEGGCLFHVTGTRHGRPVCVHDPGGASDESPYCPHLTALQRASTVVDVERLGTRAPLWVRSFDVSAVVCSHPHAAGGAGGGHARSVKGDVA
jgi:hypothetical protein